MDVSQQLKLHHDVMTNRDSSSAVQHSSLAILHKIIIPIISVVADSLERSANNFTPIPVTSSKTSVPYPSRITNSYDTSKGSEYPRP